MHHKWTRTLPEGFAVFLDCSFPVLILKEGVSNVLQVLGNSQNLLHLNVKGQAVDQIGAMCSLAIDFILLYA